MANSKVTDALLYSLAIISIVGFLGIVAETWLGFDMITKNTTSIMLIVLGTGLTVEGKIKYWKSFRQGGFTSTEVAHIVTGVLGLFAIGAGILNLVGFAGPTLMTLRGIIAVIAIIIIVLQTWVID